MWLLGTWKLFLESDCLVCRRNCHWSGWPQKDVKLEQWVMNCWWMVTAGGGGWGDILGHTINYTLKSDLIDSSSDSLLIAFSTQATHIHISIRTTRACTCKYQDDTELTYSSELLTYQAFNCRCGVYKGLEITIFCEILRVKVPLFTKWDDKYPIFFVVIMCFVGSN